MYLGLYGVLYTDFALSPAHGSNIVQQQVRQSSSQFRNGCHVSTHTKKFVSMEPRCNGFSVTSAAVTMYQPLNTTPQTSNSLKLYLQQLKAGWYSGITLLEN